ncbi:MAG: hypothetical protein F2763_09590 [Actinobacteria bacterium]|uniref:Unannotated protein n=1 Tax=freshwater metagenome TaxID=449393 RepID=A0A6J7AT71_9ZZZZ|nr:hypothetical protein [Actinomycetota bacterium]
MIDVLPLIAFIALPIAMFVVTRSLTWVATRVAFAFGIAGNAVQSSISLGMSWNMRGLQVVVIAIFVLLLALAFVRRGSPRGGVRRQLYVIVLPMVALGLFLILMRVFAPSSPGPLTGVGYLIKHTIAEDNAKWLNLSSQLAAGQDLVFNGYAGGPLILVMVMMAALISVLSMLLLGGVNEVAVAVNIVIGTQFFLIALVPIAFAPFAERVVPLWPRVRGAAARVVPAPLVWVAMFVVGIASSVVTSYGHLSFQFVLIVLVLWATVFLLGTKVPHARLLMTLVIATTASVWLPLNVVGIGLIAICFFGTIIRSNWLGLALVVLTVLAVWDALISSTLYLLGIDLHAGGGSGDGAGAPEPSATSTLFQAAGGTEIVQPLLGGLALAALLFVVAWYTKSRPIRGWRAAMPFAPIAVMVCYVLAITIGDAIITGGAPHYGDHKLAFAVVIMIIGSTLPIAILALEPNANGMTLLRWFAVGGVVLLLSLDTMLPRAISALSPALWPAIDKSAPAFWSPAEVRNTPNQTIDSLPLACVFAPTGATAPGGLPDGQLAYSCTRLLIGLNGLEGRVGPLSEWLLNDWLGNTTSWSNRYESLAEDKWGVANRQVILMNSDKSVAGLASLQSLLDSYPPTPK